MNTILSRFRNYCLLLCALVALGACDDPRLDKIVDDSVYLANYGLHQQNVYTGEGFTYPVTVVKAGAGLQGGKVRLKVNDALITKYGGNYTVLPQQYYQIRQGEINLSKGDYRVAFNLDFDAAGIQTLAASTGLTYALPLELESAEQGLSLADNQDLSTMLLVPRIQAPYISFRRPGLQDIPSAINPNSAAETKFYAFVTTNYNNEWDLTYEVTVDASVLDAYNTANGTSHRLLPADAYRIASTTLKIPNLQNESSLEYYLIKGKAAAGNYMLPLRISSVSKHGIDPARSTMLIPVSIN